MDLVSVVIPYFKKKKFIQNSVYSALNQTYSNLEIIIVYDDEDRTDLDYLRKTFDSIKKISIIVNKKNMGAGISRNVGMKVAKGIYVSFLDADDTWEKNKIQKQLNFMIKNDAKISHTSYQIIDDENKIIGFRKAKNFQNYKEIVKSCDIGLSSVIIKKEIISDEISFVNLKTKEDFVLWLKILKNDITIYGLDENLLSWRKTHNSLSSSSIQKLNDGYKVYNKYLGYNYFISFYYLICLSFNYIKKRFND